MARRVLLSSDMRTISTALVVFGTYLAGCTSPSIDPAQLTGTWTGTQSNNQTFRYTFAGSTVQYGPVLHDTTFVPLMSGTVTAQGESLVFDASFTQEDGSQSRARITLDSHLASAGLCVGVYRSQGSDMLDNGRWTSETTMQPLDATGAAVGAPQTSFDAIVTYNDNTYIKDNGESGTWAQQGDTITFATTPHMGISEARSFVLVDDVLCDPLFSR